MSVDTKLPNVPTHDLILMSAPMNLLISILLSLAALGAIKIFKYLGFMYRSKYLFLIFFSVLVFASGSLGVIC